MNKKYEKSFDTQDELPERCPKCNTEFDMNEDIQTDPFENGYITTLNCSKCDYKKVLSFTTEKDVEDEINAMYEEGEESEEEYGDFDEIED